MARLSDNLRNDIEELVDKHNLDNQEGDRLFTIVDYLMNCIDVYNDVVI